MDTARLRSDYHVRTETSFDAAYDSALWRVQKTARDVACFLAEFLLKEPLSDAEKDSLWRMYSEISAFLAALAKIPFLKAGYNPGQPRVPRGSSDGGQWTRAEDDGKPQNPNQPEATKPLVPPYDPPIEPIHLEIAILRLLPVGRMLSAWMAFAQSVAQTADAVEFSGWKLGKHKSAQKWANRISNRDWTPEEITETITKGKQFDAISEPNKPNTATRYEYKGRFVVVDDETNEILQLSRDDFGELSHD